MNGFEQLSADERARLKAAPALIALLVGAADGDFDREEKTWACKLVEARTYAKPVALQSFYKEVAERFDEDRRAAEARFPSGAGERNALISNELAALNPILKKLSPTVAAGLYRSFKGLAEEVAKASGGFLRLGAVSDEEAKWASLPMLDAIDTTVLKDELEAEWREEDAEKERAKDE